MSGEFDCSDYCRAECGTYVGSGGLYCDECTNMDNRYYAQIEQELRDAEAAKEKERQERDIKRDMIANPTNYGWCENCSWRGGPDCSCGQ
jgi:hypothetical protein